MKTVILIQGQDYSLEKRETLYNQKRISLPTIFRETDAGELIKIEYSYPGLNETYSEIKSLLKSSQNSTNIFTISANETVLNIENITTLMQQAKHSISTEGEPPLIIVLAHGLATKSSDLEITPHCIYLSNNSDANNSPNLLYSATLFKIINDYINVPVELVLLSCQSGPAKQYVHLLPSSSRLITYSNDTQNVKFESIDNSIHFWNNHNMSDISALSIIQGLILNSQNIDEYLGVSVSVAGKKFFSFIDFLNKHEENPSNISMQDLRTIFHNLEQIGYTSKITNLYKNLDEANDFVMKHCSKHKVLKEKFFKEYKWDSNYQFSKEINDIVLDLQNSEGNYLADALALIIKGKVKEESINNRNGEYEDFLKFNNIINEPVKANQIAHYIMMSLYSKQTVDNINIESLSGLRKELVLMLDGQEFKEGKKQILNFFNSIKDNTGFDILEKKTISTENCQNLIDINFMNSSESTQSDLNIISEKQNLLPDDSVTLSGESISNILE